jgi:hypothetical protein
MLIGNQEIIYRENGNEIVRITKDNFKELPLGVAQYVRHYQPFTKKNDFLSIPIYMPLVDREAIIRTSEIQDVERRNNTLVIKTLNSAYEIEYKGIDLERVLTDDSVKGINKPVDRIIPPKFPEK